MRVPILTLTTCFIAACAGLPSVDSNRAPAVIVFFGDTSTIASPDTVEVGAPFTVRVTTFGGGCVRSTAGADVTGGDGVIEIRPYNHDTGGPICTSDLMFLTHEVDVRATAAGPLVIRVIGTRREANLPAAVFTRLERGIFVR